MASIMEFLQDMGTGAKTRQPTSTGAAVGMVVADSVIEFGGGWLLGEVYARYADKHQYVEHLPEIVGGVGKFTEALVAAFWGPGWISSIAGSVGSVGAVTAGLNIGLERGRKARGLVAELKPSTAAAKLPAGKKAQVGELPPADPSGHALPWDQIREMAATV